MAVIYDKWRNLMGQDVRGQAEQAPVQGPEPPPAPQPPQQQQQQPMRQPRARSAPRYGRPISVIDAMRNDHFAKQAQMTGDTNRAISKEMDSRRKIAAQQRENSFASAEADKQRAHEKTMMQMKMGGGYGGSQDGGPLTHQKLDVLEGLMSNSRKTHIGPNKPNVEQRKWGIIRNALS